mmetsp:Transcript_135544/g.289898  ORF Transcript_135544/g.289898 Transcript_135544/m.289898 type:complete len:226 (-) Transcript_135544:1510-2187(-)
MCKAAFRVPHISTKLAALPTLAAFGNGSRSACMGLGGACATTTAAVSVSGAVPLHASNEGAEAAACACADACASTSNSATTCRSASADLGATSADDSSDVCTASTGSTIDRLIADSSASTPPPAADTGATSAAVATTSGTVLETHSGFGSDSDGIWFPSSKSIVKHAGSSDLSTFSPTSLKSATPTGSRPTKRAPGETWFSQSCSPSTSPTEAPTCTGATRSLLA